MMRERLVALVTRLHPMVASQRAATRLLAAKARPNLARLSAAATLLGPRVLPCTVMLLVLG